MNFSEDQNVGILYLSSLSLISALNNRDLLLDRKSVNTNIHTNTQTETDRDTLTIYDIDIEYNNMKCNS